MILLTNNKTITQVYKELVEILKQEGLYGEMEYFSSMVFDENEMFPVYRWISCFSVEGGNEGHYIHIETINLVGDRRLLYVGKTFEGLDHALKISSELTKAFYR